MKKVLIVVDAQEDFTRGALRNEDAINALPTIAHIVDFAQEHNMKIYYTKDTHGKYYLYTQEGTNLPIQHCVRETPGWCICKEVLPASCDNVSFIEKRTFGYDDWQNIPLDDADEIWMCGFCTDICVSANFQLIKAHYPETPIVVISDACAGVTPELHDAALKVMKSCQGKIVSWEDLRKEQDK